MARYAQTDGEGNIIGEGLIVLGEIDGAGLTIRDGDRMGLDTMVAGQATVVTSAVTAASKIFITRQTAGGTLGHLSISNVVAGVSFKIVSTSTTEVSQIAWLIIEPS